MHNRLNWAWRWHCPPDTGFEIRALAVWGRASYLSVTEAPHNTDFHTWMGKKHFVSFKLPRPGSEPQTVAWKAAVLTTTLGPPPIVQSKFNGIFFWVTVEYTNSEKHKIIYTSLFRHKWSNNELWHQTRVQFSILFSVFLACMLYFLVIW